MERGRLTGFVSGCFDWMTPAHVRLFELAKARCDSLHVLMADDVTVRHYKGALRPLMSYQERFVLVSNCQHVDYVHKLIKTPDGSNQRDLIELIHPDFYFEGIDQTDKDIGEYLEAFDIQRVTLCTGLPHVSDYLRKYDLKRYDQTRSDHNHLHEASGL